MTLQKNPFEEYSLTSRLFVYGSLAQPDTFARLIGTRFAVLTAGDKPPGNGLFGVPGVLQGYRDRVPMARFPIATPHVGARVEGLLLFRLTEGMLRRLDRYEGRAYRRRNVTISTATGCYEAFCYVASGKGG